MNTNLKMKAKHDFKKHFYKLMINAVFGKNCGKCKKTKTLNLSQQKEEITFCQNLITRTCFIKIKGLGIGSFIKSALEKIVLLNSN